jgi:alpha-glucosidase (family GH31 glycosyl hydrolase)
MRKALVGMRRNNQERAMTAAGARHLGLVLLLVLGTLAGGCAGDDDDDSGVERPDDDAAAPDDDAGDDDDNDATPDDRYVTLENGTIRVDVWLDPFGARLWSLQKGIVTETRDYGREPAFYYSRDGKRFALTEFLDKQEIDGGVSLRYRTSEGINATVAVVLATERSAKVSLSLERNDGWLWVGHNMALMDNEAIYGLTERINSNRWTSELFPQEIGSLDRRGEWIPMIVLRSIGIYTPFYQSSRGYGFYADSTFYGLWDVGRADEQTLNILYNTDQNHDPALTYYLFYGPSHDAILDEYTALTGRPFIPPEWAFKHWRWRDECDPVAGELDGHAVNAQVAEDITKYDELDFPHGVYMIDRPWTPGPQGFAEFAFDPERFPNAGDMLASFFSRDYHFIIWGAPWALGFEEGQNGWEADQGGYFAPHSRKYIDYTNPAAYAWWQEKVRAFSADNQVHGWKLDRGDEEQPSTWWDIYYDGRTGAEVRNAYSVIYQKCYFDAMQEAWGDDFVNVYRAGYSGSQQYGIANCGDVRGALSDNPDAGIDLGLRSAIISQLRVAFMGFPIWGSNTGGYQEFRDREVFARWLEFSAFSGLMDIGGIGNHAPWSMPTDPAYDEEMIAIYRTYTNLHHDLAPYLHDYALSSAENGHAVARPLVFDYPDDPTVRDMWDEYFYGPDILVAPVWHVGVRERDVYIPEGDFADYWAPSDTVSGPVTISAEVPLDRIPIFIRKGANVLGRIW